MTATRPALPRRTARRGLPIRAEGGGMSGPGAHAREVPHTGEELDQAEQPGPESGVVEDRGDEGAAERPGTEQLELDDRRVVTLRPEHHRRTRGDRHDEHAEEPGRAPAPRGRLDKGQ